ncbi:MAG: hypothetical protein AB1813_28565, partial [Verrucomicrobiota bacterium]
MNIKILCECGTKFAFDIEPVGARMPVPVPCPGCGKDCTEAANQIIQQNLSSASPQPSETARPQPVAIVVGTAKPAGASVAATPQASGTAPPSGPVRVAVAGRKPPPPPEEGADAAQSAASSEPEVHYCPKHPQEVVTAECVVCNKPICAECMEQFGFLCSVYCQQQAENRKIKVPVYERQKRHVRAVGQKKEKKIFVGIAAVLAALLGVWIWYSFFASKPHLAFAIKAPAQNSFFHAQWFGPDKLLVLARDRVFLHEAATGKELWNTPLPGVAKPDPRLNSDLPFYFPGEFRVVGNDLWLAFPQRAVRIDLQSGKVKSEIPFSPAASEILMNDAILVAIAPPGPARQLLTRVDLVSGQVQTETIPVIQYGPDRNSSSMELLSESIKHLDTRFTSLRTEFLLSGNQVVQLVARLIEPSIVSSTRQEPKDPGPSVIDKPNLRASDSTLAAEEFMRGKLQIRFEDESKYLIQLKRIFGSASEFRAELNGYTRLFPLKTVDVLVHGKTLQVFNRNQQKLWESKLTYPIAGRYSGDEAWEDEDQKSASSNPFLEAAGRLYVSDLGQLAAFDLKNGQALWRLPSVGISNLEPDNRGHLYVATTSAGPEVLQYLNVDSKDIYPIIVKVETSSGKMLWQ